MGMQWQSTWQLRQITIGGLYRARKRGAMYVPFIRLCGRWLQAAGFEIDRQVRIEVLPGRLVLTVMERNEQETEKSGRGPRC